LSGVKEPKKAMTVKEKEYITLNYESYKYAAWNPFEMDGIDKIKSFEDFAGGEIIEDYGVDKAARAALQLYYRCGPETDAVLVQESGISADSIPGSFESQTLRNLIDIESTW